ncbi:hypothetical protein V2J09_015340 [Rumex salicifolius]
MTLDDDTGHFHPSPPRKSYNPFDSDDDTLDSPGLKSENVFTEENRIGVDLKALDESADALDNGDLSWEEAVFGEPVNNPSTNGHTNLFEKDGQLYTDKNVTECELPEILVCYRENNYQSVKDIGIDEGMPIHDKVWVPSSKDETKESSSLLALIRESDDAMKIEKSCCQVDAVEIPKSGLDCEWKKDHALNPSVEGLSEEAVNGEYPTHEFVNEGFIKITELKLDSENIASSPADCNTTKIETPPSNMVYDVSVSHQSAEPDPKKNDFKEPCEPHLIGKDEVDSIVVQEPCTGETSPEPSTECREAIAKLDKIPNEEVLPNTLENVAVQESAYVSDSNRTGYIVKLESGNQVEEPETVEPEKPPASQSMTRQEAKSTNSTVAILEPRFHGETSFSSITFTGPVSYSGNISLRSESSAGSTRSFAFPILQTEWNSSPERMVKADQRHAKKQKGGWVQALVCCRF